jgi:hypothetical protein
MTHKNLLLMQARSLFGSAPLPLVHEEECVEYDGFGERDGQDGLNQNLGRSSGVATHGFGRFHTDESYAERRTESGQADVDISTDFCQHWH